MIFRIGKRFTVSLWGLQKMDCGAKLFIIWQKVNRAKYSLTHKVRKPLPLQFLVVLTGKKTKGRKRHIVADLYGNILAVKVHSASIHDTKAGLEVAKNAVEIYPSIEKFSADGGYRGTFIAQVNQFLKREVEISKKIKSPDFHVIKDRWVVERPFAWLFASPFQRLWNFNMGCGIFCLYLSPSYLA